MCGFCGYVDNKNTIQNDKIIKEMTGTLIKRGPDSNECYIDNNAALGHTRLSIIDVKNGMQPMSKEYNNNKYTIVYNGELYNTNELRKDLENKGYFFFSKCDTEVVLTAYIEYSTKCVNYLNGIFAFAIYDKNNNSVFLARDRLGIKPLFYAISTNSTFMFASEIKAILKHPEITPILDKKGLMELFGLGPCHSPRKYFLQKYI